MIKKFQETGLRPDQYRLYVRLMPGTELEKAYALASLLPINNPKLKADSSKIGYQLG